MQTTKHQASNRDNSTDTDSQLQIQANAPRDRRDAASLLEELAADLRARAIEFLEPDTEDPITKIGADIDDVADVITNARRRFVIRATAQDGTTSISRLSDSLAEQEHGEHFNCQQRKAIYVALYQGHLGLLDDAGAIEYDKDRGTVTPGPHLDGYDELVRLLDTRCSSGQRGDE